MKEYCEEENRFIKMVLIIQLRQMVLYLLFWIVDSIGEIIITEGRFILYRIIQVISTPQRVLRSKFQ